MSAYKNSGIQPGSRWKDNAVFASMLLMILSLLASRAALSTSMILFLILAIVDKDIRQLCRNFFASPYFPAFTLLFWIPFVSGLWSQNTGLWLDVVRIKLPLLFFPLAFAGNWQLNKQQWQWLALAFLAVVFAGCAFSLLDYAGHFTEINAGYLKAKTLWTPLGNDHVRFSWLVAVAIVGCFFFNRLFGNHRLRLWFWSAAGFFIVFLHLLSVRTGLGACYLFFFLYSGRLLVKKRQRTGALALLVLSIALPLLAYLFVPTFQNRVRYLVYDFSFVRKAEYLPGANDGARVLSLKAGWRVLKEHPWGVGAGDVAQEMDRWYKANVPQILPSDKLNPCSEWLMHGAFAGWTGLILFSGVLLLPVFFRPKQHAFFWMAFHATAAFSFLFDMGLEVQYGIFLYAFITFWWWRLGNQDWGVDNSV